MVKSQIKNDTIYIFSDGFADQFGGPKGRLYERIQRKNATELSSFVESIGITLFTLADDVYVIPPDFARRLRLHGDHIRYIVTGEEIRDWTIEESYVDLYPYRRDFSPIDIESYPGELEYLNRFKSLLARSVGFGGQTKVESGSQWFEYGRLTTRLLRGLY